MLAKAAKETPSFGDVSFHIVGPPVCTVSVFGKKSDTVSGFFGVFLCGFAVFGPLLRPPLNE